MEVVNESRGAGISSDAELRESFWGRFLGLMLSGRKDVVLAARQDGVSESTIHMLFMLYPIDVVWVNSKMVVVDVKKNVPAFNPFKPSTWKVHKPCSPARYVVELAVGQAGQTQKGDKINFK